MFEVFQPEQPKRRPAPMKLNNSVAISTRGILSTSDYSIFKTLHGNRNISKSHVKELQRLMIDNGNLTAQFPVVVNSRMEVLDGQHRLQALKELGWEVAYIIEDAGSIEMVRAINLGNKNWNWLDMAESYITLGHTEYKWFLDYIKKYNLTFTVAMRFCGKFVDRRQSSDYYSGRLHVEDKDYAVRLAKHYVEVLDYVSPEIVKRDFALALAAVHKSPHYDEERMLKKLSEKGHTLPNKATQEDFKRKLEELFNESLRPENRVRLF